MKTRKEYILILGITLMGWGMMFPQYTFTNNSYRMITEYEAVSGQGEMTSGQDEAVTDEDVQDICLAVREGRVRYSFKIAEYIRELFH